MMAAGRLLRQLVLDESGQDVVEYALLAVFVGLTSIAAFNFITSSMGTAFTAWDSGVQDLWIMPEPGGS